MAGNKIGGAKAAATNKRRYGNDYYRTLGKLGGTTKKTKPSGFAADRERAVWAGRLGGINAWRERNIARGR
jgi:general stress protein YciG